MNILTTALQPVFWLIVVYSVGLIGLSIPETRTFLNPMTTWNLLFSVAMVLISVWEQDVKKFIWGGICVAILGWTAEWIGVHTGWLFGSYAYGDVLGWGPMRIPLMIGVNWAILSYSIHQWVRFLNGWKRWVAGSSIMTIFDALMEPVAIKLGYWSWTEGHIPWTNYLTWWALSIPCMLLWDVFGGKTKNGTAAWLFLIQLAFFILLNFSL